MAKEANKKDWMEYISIFTFSVLTLGVLIGAGIDGIVNAEEIRVLPVTEDCVLVELTEEEYKYTEQNSAIFGEFIVGRKLYKEICK